MDNTTDTNNKKYLELSQLFYSATFPKARLFGENPGTAKLLELAEPHRSMLTGLEYEEFCDSLAELIDIPTGRSFNVDGQSANWITVYQFIHNGRVWSEFLLEVLTKLPGEKKEILLPITPKTFESLEIDEDTKNGFIEKFWEVFLFKQFVEAHRK
jgi:vesicle coat complex subunit